MIDISQIDYSLLDRPEILMFLFHPRPEWEAYQCPASAEDMLIEVEKDVVVGARFHAAGKNCPTILFFHGNGEIVADYNEMGPLYLNIGINFLPVDYRGYGRSSGEPTISTMMRDAHVIFNYVKNLLVERGYTGSFLVMGRSLGSASALEISAHYSDKMDGLIIESGFAFTRPLLRLLGIDMEVLGIGEDDGFRNRDKIAEFSKPTLIIHGEHDQLISVTEGQVLYNACPAEHRRLLIIKGATHNDIFMRGIGEYMGAIRELTEKLSAVSTEHSAL
jgi:pimeloyl-ACP methyl ester carboxylesterase